jgi:hypothetical protein
LQSFCSKHLSYTAPLSLYSNYSTHFRYCQYFFKTFCKLFISQTCAVLGFVKSFTIISPHKKKLDTLQLCKHFFFLFRLTKSGYRFFG